MMTLQLDREPFETWTRDSFLRSFPGQEEKWGVFVQLKNDWICRYGTLKGIQSFRGRKFSFLSKLKWAFEFLDKRTNNKKR